MPKQIVGLVEKIKIRGKDIIEIPALFDTGSKLSSIDIKLAAKAELGPIVRITNIKIPSLKETVKRPVVKATLEIRKKKFNVEVNLLDRSHMAFPVLVGRNILDGNFLVDVQKGKELFKQYGGEKETTIE